MLDSKGFDNWILQYDGSVKRSDEAGEYPFAGYGKILGTIRDRILAAPGRDVLDLGFGTAALTAQLYEAGCRIYGQDFSEGMRALAQEKMPEAKLYPGDFSEALAEELTERQYDAIFRAEAAVKRASEALRAGFTPDAVLTDAEEALAALGEVSGRTLREDLVEAVFSRFCVGK